MALPAALVSAASGAETLDFEKLLSRDKEPSRVAQLQVQPLPKELYKQHHSHHSNKHHNKRRHQQHQQRVELEDEETKKAKESGAKEVERVTEHVRSLVMNLARQTPAFLRRLTPEERQETLQQRGKLLTNNGSASTDQSSSTLVQPQRPYTTVPPKFSPLELMDWESQIDWGDEMEGSSTDQTQSATTTTTTKPVAATTAVSRKRPAIVEDEESAMAGMSSTMRNFMSKLSPEARQLLQHKRNPFLDNISFDDGSVIVGYGDTTELARKAAEAPLILELGVAGQSVAHKVYQNSVLTAQHPTPAILQYAYQARVNHEWEAANGGGGKNSSITDEIAAQNIDARNLSKQELKKLIEEQSKRREQLAKAKTNRVKAALGTLALGGGTGRAITSSLMGPGGTERTGRPTRMNAAGTLENEYIEQLDLVTSHALVQRDLSKIILRQFRRPKLPDHVVRPDLPWQFQIRFSARHAKELQAAAAAAERGGGGGGGAGVPHSPFARSGGNAHHHHQQGGAQIRTEADLSPSEGKLIVVEYCEERPPIQLSKGMATKIINYFRGDKAHCPVSAGGGDRPARRKRNDEAAASDSDKHGGGGASGKGSDGASGQQGLPRLSHSAAKSGGNKKSSGGGASSSPKDNSILDWIGPLPKKNTSKMLAEKKSGQDAQSQQSVDILPEGVTEVLHPSVQGPFLGEIPEGATLTGLISNLFVAPLFRHEPEPTDFLMILTPPGGVAHSGRSQTMGVILRDMPKSVYTVGQTEPRTRVHAPLSPGEKSFSAPYISYQIARAITRSQARDGHGLRLDEMQRLVLPNLELPGNAFRQRLKHVAIYDKNTQIWTTKQIGFEGYPGVDALGKSISPEGVTAFETACAASRRLTDLGIHQLFSGNNTAASVAVTMVYLAGHLNAQRDLSRKLKRSAELMASGGTVLRGNPLQAMYYGKAAEEMEALYKVLRHKHEVAQFINEELQLAPWHLSGEFIDVHKKAEGTGMMKLTGLGDPSGKGEGFSFIREIDTKPSKSVGNAALNAQVKKITGTEDDLRKLTMQQMASLLRSYGMAQKQIDTLKRWDRVHCIRDLSTKAASDGIGDGLERFARGEKMKLSEQKQMYRDRIQEIFRRQIAALSASQGDAGGDKGEDADAAAAQNKENVSNKAAADDDSDDSEEDEMMAAELEEQMMDTSEANQLVAQQAAASGGKDMAESSLGQLRAAAQDQETSKEARELAALRRQREEEKTALEGLQSTKAGDMERHAAMMANRKVIRKRITKTHPDGRQTTTFKFILHPEEVGKIEARLAAAQKKDEPARPKEWNYQYGDDEKPPGHAMFEDEDNFEYSSRGRLHSGKRRTGGGRKPRDGRSTPRARAGMQFGGRVNKQTKAQQAKEDRMRKRKREEEELEVYNAQSKRKTTNNRRERGSIRDRAAHVIFADKLEAIRAAVESRPYASPFLKPVNRKILPRYYEVIGNPIDLQTIRNKIAAYEYRKADSLLQDFELMKANAIKFNGESNHIAQEAVSIYDFVRDQIQASRAELSKLEADVESQMTGDSKTKGKKGGSGGKRSGKATPTAAAGGTPSGAAAAGSVGITAQVGGNTVNLGDVQEFMLDSDSGEDDEIPLGV